MHQIEIRIEFPDGRVAEKRMCLKKDDLCTLCDFAALFLARSGKHPEELYELACDEWRIVISNGRIARYDLPDFAPVECAM